MSALRASYCFPLCVLLVALHASSSFIIEQSSLHRLHRLPLTRGILVRPGPHKVSTGTTSGTAATSSTAVRALLDVPDGFFTITFPTLGILLSLSKNFARIRMEERAWEQRLAEGRRHKLASDPTLTELDLRRMEAAQEWSAYGKPRLQEEEQLREQQQQLQQQQQQRRSRSRVAVADEELEMESDSRDGIMSDEEIATFESLYGVEYDPYYDDPYTEEELPQGKYTVDKMYGDRVYADGEVFYKTNEGLYYRQGAKPRNWKFW